MYRITGRNGNYYAVKIKSVLDELENIEGFVDEGDPVMIVNEVEDVKYFDIDLEDVEIVEAG